MIVKEKPPGYSAETAVLEGGENTVVRFGCYLFLIFLAGCFVGWIYEEIFYWITEGMLRNRGVLYGPWLPIYGFGALGIYGMKGLKRHPVLLFCLCVGITGVLEYLVGYIGIRFFEMRLWDYRGMFLNIGGIVCFRSVVSFGFLGLFFHYVLEPFARKKFREFRISTLLLVCGALAAVFVSDLVCSLLFRTPITY